MIVKNLTFTVPPSIWDTKRGFALLEIDKKDKNIRALLRWNPVLTKATYKIKMVNGTTKEWYRHDLIRTELIDDNRYILAFWNPYETMDAIMGMVPPLTVAAIVMGIFRHFSKKEELAEIKTVGT